MTKFDPTLHGVPVGVSDPKKESWIVNCHLDIAKVNLGGGVWDLGGNTFSLFDGVGCTQPGTMFVRLNGWAIIPKEEYEDLVRRAGAPEATS